MQAWEAGQKSGAPPAALLKQYVPHSIDTQKSGDRKHTFTITTGAVDRDRDVVKPEGAQLDNYRKNPVVLWAHRSWDPPIGKAESIISSAGAIKARVEYVPGDVYPLAETVRQMVDGGFLRATSIGFIPTKYAIDEQRGGFDILEWDLLEFSICPVPANPEALLAAKDAGVDIAPVTEWCEQMLDTLEPGLWVPKAVALRALEATKAPAVVVPDLSGALEKATDAILTMGKRGRVLSRENEDRIRAARGKGDELVRTLDEVIAQVEEIAEEVAEEGKAVLYVQESPKFIVQAEVVEAATRAAVSEAIRGAVSAATGRLAD